MDGEDFERAADLIEMAAMPAFRARQEATFRRQMVGMGALGFATIGFLPFLSLYLEKGLHVGEAMRGVIVAVLATATLLGTLIGGRLGERAFQRSPAVACRLVGMSLLCFGAITTVALLVPWGPRFRKRWFGLPSTET